MDTFKTQIEEVLKRGVEKIYPSSSFLKEKLLQKKPLNIYVGLDPTFSSLHIGHLIVLNKMSQFQALGHHIFLLIGDFTALIGDPTGKSTTRPVLSVQEVTKNSRRFAQQAKKFLSFSGENPAKIVYNSQWSKKLNPVDLIRLTSHFTVQQMIVRDMFQERIKHKKPIFIHEFLYPIFQAYDSVALEADVEVGGNDQTFNMLCGRDLVKDLQHREKVVMTLKLLVGSKGKKMSKTSGAAIFLDDKPAEMYGKIMSYPDDLLESAFELCTQIPEREIQYIKKSMSNPRDVKARLAQEIVTRVWGKAKAFQAEQEFKRIFQAKSVPLNLPTIKLDTQKEISILDLLTKTHLAVSRAEARRLILQGGVKIDQKVQKTWEQMIVPKSGMIIQRGKRRFVKIL